jgi:hypothetical protein
MLFCHAAIRRKIEPALATVRLFGTEQTSVLYASIVRVIANLLVKEPHFPATVQSKTIRIVREVIR